MKYANSLDDLLGQKSKVKILRCLSNSCVEMSGRQIASDVKMSPWACHQALQELTEQGVLLMRNVGRTYLFRLNERNYLVRELLLPLFQKEKGLLETAIQEIIEGISDAIVSIVLYGSVSRGEERPFSDFDLLILVPTSAGKEPVQDIFDRKNDDFISRFGNVLSPLVLSVAEFRERYREKDALIREVVDAGRVVYGKLFSEVLAHEPQEGPNEGY